jgi:tRNA uracil 4-sulfurtransferase
LTEFVVHYSEVALKGKNRPEFVSTFRRNLRRALRSFPGASEVYRDGRILVRVEGDEHAVRQALSKVFGVSWLARVSVTEESYDSISAAVAREAATLPRGGTFMMSTRRIDKNFPVGSMELARRLGKEVAEETGLKVSLGTPGSTIFVDVLKGSAVVYSDKLRGPGGLPVGVGGRVVHLFSGGIDSPVAAWLLMKRGCMPVYLHFYLAPSPEYAVRSKITGIVRLLAELGGRATTVLVPFADYQVATAGEVGDLEPSLFRRFMRMTAEHLAPGFGAAAISTGDSLSQAASQTLWNLRALDSGSSLPILRPLLSYDKQEIVDLAKRIGTYELSIQEYRDCCSVITRHPKTRAKEREVSESAARLGFPALVQECLSKATLVVYNPVTGTTKTSPFSLLAEEPRWAASGGFRPSAVP